MKTILVATLNYMRHLATSLASGWNRFWFAPSAPTTLGMIRICAGLVLLYVHLTTFHRLLDHIGPHAWIDDQAVKELAEMPATARKEAQGMLQRGELFLTPEMQLDDLVERNRWYRLSVYELPFLRDPLLIQIVQAGFILAMICFTVGLFTRVAAPLAWLGHLSYIQRGYIIWFGMDSMILFILFYLMFAPCGWALSFDRLIARYRAIRRTGLGRESLGDAPPVPWHWSATTLTRMIQIHMSIVYFCAGVAKLQGATWWSGYATWMTMHTSEFALVDMRWFGQFPMWLIGAITTFATYATLAFEIAFVFLIWYPFWRPILLFVAVGLHAGIGFFMGLMSFGVIMLTGCMSFVSPAGMDWFVTALFAGPKNLRFMFNRHDATALRQATLLKTFDVWNQIDFVDAASPSGGGQLQLPNGAVAQGKGAVFAATRRLAALWLTWPVALALFPGSGSTPTAGPGPVRAKTDSVATK